MLYQFREYAQKINANQTTDAPGTGFDLGGQGRLVSINFDGFDPSKPYTVACSGARRGGSSTLPYILNRLGLAMGEIEADTYEDTEMLRCRHNAERLQEVIAKRNTLADQWGFKIPSIRRGQLGFFDAKLRNPVFLYIFRNPLLAAQSYLTQVENDAFPSNRKGLSAALNETLVAYSEFAAFLQQTRSPCLLVSMELLQRNPAACLEDIATRLGLSTPADVIEDLVENLRKPGFKPRARA